MAIGAKMNMIVQRELYIKEMERMISEMEHMWKQETGFSNEMSFVTMSF